MMRGFARCLALAGAVLVASCGSSASGALTVHYARVDLLDGAGVVTQSINVVTDGAIGPSVPLPLNVTQRFRVTWMTDDSLPDASAANPSLTMRFGIPLAPYGLTFVQSPTARYEGTLLGATVQASPVFVPLQLYDNAQGNTVFSTIVHFTVQ
jgi:hypothetical protein